MDDLKAILNELPISAASNLQVLDANGGKLEVPFGSLFAEQQRIVLFIRESSLLSTY